MKCRKYIPRQNYRHLTPKVDLDGLYSSDFLCHGNSSPDESCRFVWHRVVKCIPKHVLTPRSRSRTMKGVHGSAQAERDGFRSVLTHYGVLYLG